MISRRDFLRISAMASAAALVNWQFPGLDKRAHANEGYDAIIIGAGLGGLSCAALLAQKGGKPLVIDQRDKVGGYATSFERYGSGIESPFLCEASLHGLTGNPLGMALLTELLGKPPEEIKSARLVPHEYSWSSVYPDFPLNIPQPLKGAAPEETLTGLGEMLVSMFPDEAKGITGYMQCWGGLLVDIAKFYNPDPDIGGLPDDISQFPLAYPTWASMLWEEKKKKTKTETKTLTDLFKEYKIKNSQLQAILGQSWPYYGLPPSEIPAWLYLMYTGFYHVYGNYYIKGTSQSLSNALAQAIIYPQGGAYPDGTPYPGGDVLLNTEVTEILLENGRAVGVKTKQGEAYYANAVVSNAAVPQTMRLLPESAAMPPEYNDYLDMISSYQPSTSHFNLWLKVDLREDDDFFERYQNLGSNTLVYPDYKHSYKGSMQCDPEKSGFAIVAYDKVDTVSPEGCASITLTMLTGYTPWEKFEAVYRNEYGGSETVRGNVTFDDYSAEKDRIAETLIKLADERVLPGLSDRATKLDASTPLTNVRFTYNNQGAIYGYDQTEENSGLTRLGNRTPIPGLYLAGAWTNPGGGFELVMLSGKEVVKCIAEDCGLF
ncbi:FAD-dependent oxidoreductase [Candidatus Electrothrix sp.]|uniref:FAD-dependent oxidoreductase n=1 Tax=Candidatus Electrothrix sp. TaxID=2170559 RepID=UPI004055F0FB